MNNYTPKKFIFLVISLLTLVHFSVFPQETAPVKADDLKQIENYQEQIKRLMGFLEFSLNTLGNPETTTKEKEIIINESYRKAFLHEKVQIEDDLDENREILTYKDVQAYLKDVDFFFKSAEFNFTIQDIQFFNNDQGMVYFKVSANRNIKAVTVNDEQINNNKTRYIEINLDDDEQVLKIASIYTTRLNEAVEMMAWWNKMPLGWKDFLGAEYIIQDDIHLNEVEFLNKDSILHIHLAPEIIEIQKFIYIGDDSLLISEMDTIWTKRIDTIQALNHPGLQILKEILSKEQLDISGNLEINDLTPVNQMSGLKSLNISGTLINDLFPARNLTKLVTLNISGTAVDDLTPILYNTLIRELYLDSTTVTSLSPVEEFSSLETLHLNATAVSSLIPLKRIASLKDLRLDYTLVNDLSPAADLVNLENLSLSGSLIEEISSLQYLIYLKRLYFENTRVTDLSPLSKLENLQLIDADMSQISDLEPLAGLSALEKIYCDQTFVTRDKANAFMENHPGVLVIYESEGLNIWWSALTAEWQQVFRDIVELDLPPTREQLHQLTLIRKLDIEGNKIITDIDPLSILTNLKEINASNSNISDLSPISEIIDLKVLSFANTPVNSLLPLQSISYLENVDFSNSLVESLEGLSSATILKVVNIENTGVKYLDPLIASRDIRFIYCDGTKVTKDIVDQFLEVHPSCLIIYQTQFLQDWWSNLPLYWKTALKAHAQLDEIPSREQLQTIADLRKIELSGNREINSLEPLTALTHLEELNVSNANLSNINPLGGLVRLKKLNISGNPISDLNPIGNMNSLVELDISNTSINKIDILENLTALEQLSLSGIGLKKLDPLINLVNLKRLECNNNLISNLNALTGLFQLRYLSCYNTKLSSKKVEAFKAAMPGVEVVFY